MKFGGTSVANAENMSKVVDIVSKAVDRDRTILVSSAISGCTEYIKTCLSMSCREHKEADRENGGKKSCFHDDLICLCAYKYHTFSARKH